jgi:ABC-type multidrug transport system fused ATPase/permease subunit
VAVIDGGRVVARGTHAELVASSAMYNEILAAALGDADTADPLDDVEN